MTTMTAPIASEQQWQFEIPTMGGIVVGLAASYPLSGLYGIGRTDLRIFAGASAVLALTVLFATWWPARKAASIEPVSALREE